MDVGVKDALKKEGLFTLLLLGSILMGAFLFLFPSERFQRTKEFFYPEAAPSLNILTNSTLSAPVVQSGSTLVSSTPKTQNPTPTSTLPEPLLSFSTILGSSYSLVPLPDKSTMIFETLTPYENLVDVKKTSIIKEGVAAGTLYQIKRKDPSIGDPLDFLRRLAKNIRPDPNVTIQDTLAYGRDGFLYNHLAKKDYFRIVILSKDGFVYAWDIRSQYREEFEKVFKVL